MRSMYLHLPSPKRVMDITRSHMSKRQRTRRISHNVGYPIPAKARTTFGPTLPKKLMVAVMLHLKATENDAAFSRVADLLCSTGYDDLKATLINSPSEKAKKETEAFFEFMEKNERLIGGLMTDVGSRFQLLLSDDVRAVTSHSDINFQRMVERPSAFYLSIPRSGAAAMPAVTCDSRDADVCCFEREARTP